MPPVSKELITKTLVQVYQDSGEIPKYTAKYDSFSASTVRNKFGSWAAALTAAGIPLRMKPSISIDCQSCGAAFLKQQSQISKYSNHFCSHSCSAKHSNTNRVDSDATKLKKSTSLKKYNKANPGCNRIHADDQVEIVNGRRLHIKDVVCIVCKIGFKSATRKLCSDACLKARQTQIGMLSQSKQSRRSKGEIKLFDLCANYFGPDNVLSNPQMFVDGNGNCWDADIVIPKYRFAICYNGIWHYQQIGEKHRLPQVQSRDRIKKKVIFQNGYLQYVVKDMGKYDEMFVYKQFHAFVFRCIIHLEMKMRDSF